MFDRKNSQYTGSTKAQEGQNCYSSLEIPTLVPNVVGNTDRLSNYLSQGYPGDRGEQLPKYMWPSFRQAIHQYHQLRGLIPQEVLLLEEYLA